MNLTTMVVSGPPPDEQVVICTNVKDPASRAASRAATPAAKAASTSPFVPGARLRVRNVAQRTDAHNRVVVLKERTADRWLVEFQPTRHGVHLGGFPNQVGQFSETRRRLRHPDGLAFLESELMTEEQYQELRARRRATKNRVRHEAKEVAKRTFAYIMSVGMSFDLARGAGKTASRRIVLDDYTAPPPYRDLAWNKRTNAPSSVPATLREMFAIVDGYRE